MTTGKARPSSRRRRHPDHPEGRPQPAYSAYGHGEGSHVLRLSRLGLVDGEPIALMTNFLPPSVLDVQAEELERSGLYDLLRRPTASEAVNPPCGRASGRGRRLPAAAQHRHPHRRWALLLPQPARRFRPRGARIEEIDSEVVPGLALTVARRRRTHLPSMIRHHAEGDTRAGASWQPPATVSARLAPPG